MYANINISIVVFLPLSSLTVKWSNKESSFRALNSSITNKTRHSHCHLINIESQILCSITVVAIQPIEHQSWLFDQDY